MKLINGNSKQKPSHRLWFQRFIGFLDVEKTRVHLNYLLEQIDHLLASTKWLVLLHTWENQKEQTSTLNRSYGAYNFISAFSTKWHESALAIISRAY